MRQGEPTTGGSVLRGGFWYTASRLIPQLYSLVISIAAARFLGPHGMGRQSFIAFAEISLVVLLGNGFFLALMRSVGETVGRNQPEAARSLLLWAVRVQAVSAAAGATVLLVSSLLGASPRAAWLLAAVVCLVAIMHTVPSAVIIGLQRWRQAAIVGLAINFGILRFGFHNALRTAVIEREPHAIPKLDRGLFAIVCAVFVSIFACFLAGLNLAWTALAGAALVMVLARRDTHEVLKLVDWHLLVFFAALFVVVDGLSDTGVPDAIYRHLQPLFGASAAAQAWNLSWFSVIGSNIFSNVPFVLVAGKWIARFAEPLLMWKVLALATTFAGNLTIIGSVANMIVVESAREHIQVGFWDYARFGIPITILTTATGVLVLLLLH